MNGRKWNVMRMSASRGWNNGGSGPPRRPPCPGGRLYPERRISEHCLFGVALMLVFVAGMFYSLTTTVHSEETVKVMVTADEHGSVNEKTGEFIEQVVFGKDCVLFIEAEDGYEIQDVLINDEKISEAEQTTLIGKKKGEVLLEKIQEDVEIRILFQESAAPETSVDAQGSDDPAAQGGDGPDAEGSDDPAAQGGDGPDAEGSDDPAAQGGDGPDAEGSDDPAAQGGEERNAEGNDDPAAQGDDGPDAEGNDDPAAQGGEERNAEGNDDPAAQGGEERNAEGSDDPAAQGGEVDHTERGEEGSNDDPRDPSSGGDDPGAGRASDKGESPADGSQKDAGTAVNNTSESAKKAMENGPATGDEGPTLQALRIAGFALLLSLLGIILRSLNWKKEN